MRSPYGATCTPCAFAHALSESNRGDAMNASTFAASAAMSESGGLYLRQFEMISSTSETHAVSDEYAPASIFRAMVVKSAGARRKRASRGVEGSGVGREEVGQSSSPAPSFSAAVAFSVAPMGV